MKGFELYLENHKVVGAIEAGVTTITISLKENNCHVAFGSMDGSGMMAYTWYMSDLTLGDKLSIFFKQIETISDPFRVIDYQDSALLEQMEVETYYKLQNELIEEGLITKP